MDLHLELTREILAALGAPFPEAELEYLPRATSGGQALALPYLSRIAVMNRLDAVVGDGWSFDFDVLSPDGKLVKGKLTVLGVTRCDAGEARGEDECLKSAVSDALKRAAIHFGVGRYLRYLPRIWAPYDTARRAWQQPPRIPPGGVAIALWRCGLGPEPAPEVSDAAAEARQRVVDTLETQHVHGGVVPAAELVCSAAGCGAVINQRQAGASVKRFGAPLCSYCARKAAAPDRVSAADKEAA
jgi:Rad52/22 family double-strand break repair protein